MIPLWLALAFLSFVTLFLAVDIPKRESVRNTAQISYDTTSVTAYGRTVTNYLKANPSATGRIDGQALGPFWPAGYKHVDGTLWSNYIDTGGKLYIFSLSPANNGILGGLYRTYAGALFVGTKESDGYFHSFDGGVIVSVPIQAGIPDKSIVIMGKWEFY